MKLNLNAFGQRHRVVLDIYIDHEGIYDGYVSYPWSIIKDCVIDIGRESEVATIFGEEDYRYRTYVIRLSRAKGDDVVIPLFGAGDDVVFKAQEAINHYSGRTFFKEVPGRKLAFYTGIALIILVILFVIIYTYINITSKS